MAWGLRPRPSPIPASTCWSRAVAEAAVRKVLRVFVLLMELSHSCYNAIAGPETAAGLL